MRSAASSQTRRNTGTIGHTHEDFQFGLDRILAGLAGMADLYRDGR